MDEKAAQKEAKHEVQTLTWVVANLKKMIDKFTAQIPEFEEKDSMPPQSTKEESTKEDRVGPRLPIHLQILGEAS
jgi:hypothetical protein